MSNGDAPAAPDTPIWEVICTPLQPDEAIARGQSGFLARLTHQDAGMPTDQLTYTHPPGQNGLMSRWIHRGPSPRIVQTGHTTLEKRASMAAAPDGSSFVVAGMSDVIEVRAWMDLRLLRTLTLPPADAGGRVEVAAIALSPDGRWLAVADSDSRMYLVDYRSGWLGPPVDTGEWTGALAFAPSGRLLASGCSYQGGAEVRVDRILDAGVIEGAVAGTLIPHYQEWRSDRETPTAEFVDGLSAVAFSPSGQHLAVFETSAIYSDQRPPGWRGDVVLYSAESGALQWCASIDAAVTGDRRSLDEAGHPLGFYTSVLFLDDDYVLCGATRGTLLVYHTETGTLAGRLQLPTDADVRVDAQNGNGTIWVVLGNGEVMTLPRQNIL